METISGAMLAASFPARAATGLVLAAIVVVAARRARALDSSGSVAAMACGTAAAAAGWKWAALLAAYFVTSALVSRAGSAEKQLRTGSTVSKDAERDAVQVLANGGVYALAAVASLLWPSTVWAWGAVGSLAASAADTWASEIGVLAGSRPRSIVNRTFVQPGMSGGVTWAGSGGAVLGAGAIAALAIAFGFSRGAALAAIASGVAGALLDSLLGAAVQQKRHCDACGTATERAIHDCGHTTRHVSGIRWIDNDLVNAATTLAGFALSAALSLMASSAGASGV